jgi:DNA polymerase-4
MRTCVRIVEPTILHADVDAFFASVEQRDDPRLRGRPTIVGGGVVLAASYEARAYGVRGAMGGAQARRLCPRAVVVRPRFRAYVDASRELFEVFRDTSPVVEGLGLEEAFLDVRGLGHISGSPHEIAVRLRGVVRERLDLPITVGVARTKLLAKMASRAAKPDGLLVVAPDRELEFLHPLRVEQLWGVGDSTARKLHSRGLRTVGELALVPEPALVALLGRAAGRHLHAIAHGRDRRRVETGRRRRSVGAQNALGRRRRSPAELDAVLAALVDRVTRRMRKAGLLGRTVVLRLRFDDFTRATRSRTLPHATAATAAVLTAARSLLSAAAPLIERRGITLVGIAVSNVERGGGIQLELPLDGVDRAALDAALDEVRERYGSRAISRAATLGRDAARYPHVLDHYTDDD